MRTQKSIVKRFKISKKGKVIKKKAGQGHFNSREKGSVTRAKRRNVTTSHAIDKQITDLIPYSK